MCCSLLYVCLMNIYAWWQNIARIAVGSVTAKLGWSRRLRAIIFIPFVLLLLRSGVPTISSPRQIYAHVTWESREADVWLNCKWVHNQGRTHRLSPRLENVIWLWCVLCVVMPQCTILNWIKFLNKQSTHTHVVYVLHAVRMHGRSKKNYV